MTIVNHQTGECDMVNCFCHEAQRLELPPSTPIPAPDFEHEWATSSPNRTRHTEEAEAKHWFQRGLWLGIQYERERGLVAMDGDLREMQRMARERITMSEEKPLIVNADGYALVLRTELARMIGIESRARQKLAQLKAVTSDAGRERRAAHVEALAFVLGTDDALDTQER